MGISVYVNVVFLVYWFLFEEKDIMKYLGIVVVLDKILAYLLCTTEPRQSPIK